MKLYLISGLGADERAFSKLHFPAGIDVVHIPWQPIAAGDDLQAYAHRMSRQIDDSQPFLLGGLSFGGIMAIEIAEMKKPEQLLLFSTIRTRHDLPRSYRLAGRLGLVRFLPRWSFRFSHSFLHYFFGPLDEECKTLVDDFLDHSDPRFLKWALGQISRWPRETLPQPAWSLHGAKDRAFPLAARSREVLVNGAGHMCVFTHAEEVSGIIAEVVYNYLRKQ